MSNDNTNWSGRVALVTGAARGIGLAVVQALGRQGCTVVGWDIPGTDWAEAQAATPNGWLAFEGDVALAEDWRQVIAATLSRFGRLDLLVNNAGVGGAICPVTRYDEAEFDRVIAINQRGVFLGLKHAGRVMHDAGRGSIINIASNAGLGGGALTIAYTASKHAVIGMTKVAAGDLGRKGVRVNAVCPSPTDTAMIDEVVQSQSPGDPAAVHRHMTGRNPTGRYAQPSEIAAAVLFLAGDAASYINGTTLLVDGGLAVGG